MSSMIFKGNPIKINTKKSQGPFSCNSQIEKISEQSNKTSDNRKDFL